jgi:hypothetical protein
LIKGLQDALLQRRLPLCLESSVSPKIWDLFDSLESQFHSDPIQYFGTLVLLIVIAWGRGNITSLFVLFPRSRAIETSIRYRRKLKVGAYGYSLFGRRHKQTFRIKKAGGTADYTYVGAGWMKVSDLGQLHVITSRKNRDKKMLGIVTDDPNVSAGQMIRMYDERWSIEVFFKDGKQLLGLGQ